MTEQSMRQALSETTDFVRRQKLLKQLWKLRRAREMDALVATADPSRKANSSKLRMPAENTVA